MRTQSPTNVGSVIVLASLLVASVEVLIPGGSCEGMVWDTTEMIFCYSWLSRTSKLSSHMYLQITG